MTRLVRRAGIGAVLFLTLKGLAWVALAAVTASAVV
jgi:hypothetical protein